MLCTVFRSRHDSVLSIEIYRTRVAVRGFGSKKKKKERKRKDAKVATSTNVKGGLSRQTELVFFCSLFF